MVTTAKKPKLNQEIATTGDGRDITKPFISGLMLPNDKVLRVRGGGDLSIYEQVLSDDQVKTCFQQRQLSVTRHEWVVTPGGDKAIDKQAAEFIKQQLKTIGFDNITTKMLYGVFYGYAVAEIIYTTDGQYITIKAIKVRNRKRFRFNDKGELRLLTRDNMFQGEPCPAPYFWSFATGADNDDEPYGLGLAHYLYWPVFFKRNGMKFWAMFLEKFAMPTVVGEFSVNATNEEKQKLLEATQAIQVDSGIIIPQGSKLALLEAARNGTGDYKAFKEAMDNAIAKVILGQTASTQGTPGKLGNDELQGDVKEDLTKADSDLINESFVLSVVHNLVSWNFAGAAIPEVKRVIEQAEDMNKKAERDKTVAEFSGFKPTKNYIQDTYNIEIDETIPRQITSNQPQVNFAESTFTPVQPNDYAEAMTDRLTSDMQPVIHDWGKQLETIVKEAKSLEEIEQKLLKLAPKLSLNEYTQLMGTALAAANYAGQNDVTDEANNG